MEITEIEPGLFEIKIGDQVLLGGIGFVEELLKYIDSIDAKTL